jgi:hypothetical protein
MIMKLVSLAAVVIMGASTPAGCADHSPKVQNVNIQDVSQFPKCTDDQGHGASHPCTTKDDQGRWIVWVVGVADCPAKTVQNKEDVKCLNAAK